MESDCEKIKVKNKKVLIISSIVVLVVALSVYYFWNRQKASQDAKNRVETVTVTKGNITSSIFTTGKVTPNIEVEIKCKASGEITQLPFDISDTVKKGQLLLKLNPIDEQRNVRQSQMTLLQSQTNLSKAKKDLLLTQQNLGTDKAQAQIALNSAKIKAKDLRTKAERSKELYLMSTQRKLAVAAVEAAKIKAKDLRTKANAAKQLYLNKSILSKSDYDTAVANADQADIDVKNAELRLQEQDTNNKNDYDTALTAAKQAEAEVKNAQENLEQQNNSKINVDIKNQDIQAAQAKVESDKLALLNSQQRLKDTEVFSPIDGVVTTRPVQVGQIITSGTSTVGGGTVVLTIADLSRMFVMATVDESDIGKVKVGQKASITADAFPDKRFRGIVRQIYTKGTNTSNVVTFSVKIEITTKNKNLLKPEMTSNIEIIQQQKENTLSVDANALTRKKGKYYVKVLKDDGTQEEREVQIGANNDSNYEITSGLKEGEKLVIDNSDAEGKWKNSTNGQNNQRGNRNSTNSMMRQTRRITGSSGGGRR